MSFSDDGLGHLRGHGGPQLRQHISGEDRSDHESSEGEVSILGSSEMLSLADDQPNDFAVKFLLAECHRMEKELKHLKQMNMKLANERRAAIKQAQMWKAKCMELKDGNNALMSAHQQFGDYMSTSHDQPPLPNLPPPDLVPHPPDLPPTLRLLGKQIGAFKVHAKKKTYGKRSHAKTYGKMSLPIGMAPKQAM